MKITSQLPLLKSLFEKHKIQTAYLFGSVLTENFNNESDIDILINFIPNLEPEERGELWWNLYYELKDSLHREIDLVKESSLKNPYFIKAVNETKVKIFNSQLNQ